MCSRQRWKDEVQLKNFCLGYQEPRHFLQFEWGWPKLYIGWRAFWAAYHLTWIIVSGFLSWQWTTSKANEIKWFIYLTDWTYFVLTLAALLDFTAVVYTHIARADIVQGLTNDITWYEKTVWVLFNIGNCGSVVVSILYWALLYSASTTTITAVDVGTHALNSVYVFINMVVIATPVRLYHVFHTMIYFLTYVLFSFIYHKSGGTSGTDKPYIYSILDWDSAPGTAVAYSCLMIFLAVPIAHVSLFLLYMLRVAVFNLLLNRDTIRDENAISMKEIDNA
ncbi:protein rolling stone-like [Gigantopelta aegis]|uniref:protein rolling stone-like n=1 Tax=Gigantopelta aegis TaxID=1735272 RepID=UPI001B888590|nr:protein rolling stone-like [Gigantopelta aegis]